MGANKSKEVKSALPEVEAKGKAKSTNGSTRTHQCKCGPECKCDPCKCGKEEDKKEATSQAEVSKIDEQSTVAEGDVDKSQGGVCKCNPCKCDPCKCGPHEEKPEPKDEIRAEPETPSVVPEPEPEQPEVIHVDEQHEEPSEQPAAPVEAVVSETPSEHPAAPVEIEASETPTEQSADPEDVKLSETPAAQIAEPEDVASETPKEHEPEPVEVIEAEATEESVEDNESEPLKVEEPDSADEQKQPEIPIHEVPAVIEPIAVEETIPAEVPSTETQVEAPHEHQHVESH